MPRQGESAVIFTVNFDADFNNFIQPQYTTRFVFCRHLKATQERDFKLLKTYEDALDQKDRARKESQVRRQAERKDEARREQQEKFKKAQNDAREFITASSLVTEAVVVTPAKSTFVEVSTSQPMVVEVPPPVEATTTRHATHKHKKKSQADLLLALSDFITSIGGNAEMISGYSIGYTESRHFFASPTQRKFWTRLEVARHLGLIPPIPPQRVSSPNVSAPMPPASTPAPLPLTIAFAPRPRPPASFVAPVPAFLPGPPPGVAPITNSSTTEV